MPTEKSIDLHGKQFPRVPHPCTGGLHMQTRNDIGGSWGRAQTALPTTADRWDLEGMVSVKTPTNLPESIESANNGSARRCRKEDFRFVSAASWHAP